MTWTTSAASSDCYYITTTAADACGSAYVRLIDQMSGGVEQSPPKPQVESAVEWLRRRVKEYRVDLTKAVPA